MPFMFDKKIKEYTRKKTEIKQEEKSLFIHVLHKKCILGYKCHVFKIYR